jgi:hypothetical protein
MTQNLDDSLNRLKLEDGVEGVQELKVPWHDVSALFKDLRPKYLHVVVERPPGEFDWITAVAAAILISFICSFSCPASGLPSLHVSLRVSCPYCRLSPTITPTTRIARSSPCGSVTFLRNRQ